MKISVGLTIIAIMSGGMFYVINSFMHDLKNVELTIVYLIISMFLIFLWFVNTKEIIKRCN